MSFELHTQCFEHSRDVFVFFEFVEVLEQLADVHPRPLKICWSPFEVAVFTLLCNKISDIKRSIYAEINIQ